jgi:hypothetical protein
MDLKCLTEFSKWFYFKSELNLWVLWIQPRQCFVDFLPLSDGKDIIDIPQPNSRKQKWRLQIGFESPNEHISNEKRQTTSHTCFFSRFENLVAKLEVVLFHALFHYVDITRNLVSVYSSRYQPFVNILESQIDWNAR